MAEPRRFQFDSDTRSVDVPAGRRRVPWYWIAISVAIHGAVVLFVLAGAARGGHTELAGTLEVTLVGAPSAGDPSGKSSETAEAKPEPSDPAARPDEKPAPPRAEALPRPAAAQPAEAQPPAPPRQAVVPPPMVQPAAPKAEIPPPPTPAALPQSPPPQPAAIPESPATPPRPDGMARPVPPPPKEPPALAAAPAEPTPPAKIAAPPPRPSLAKETASVTPPPRPRSAPAATSTPAAAPSTKNIEKAAAPKHGIKKAVEGQTASLGSPIGGDRLGRSENDDASGVLNVNLNPRFRQPPPPPRYPRLSVERDEEGVVLVRAFVDPAGAPQRVIVFRSSGFPLLDDAALKAVQGWRFEPMVRDGRATAAWVQVPVRFRLN